MLIVLCCTSNHVIQITFLKDLKYKVFLNNVNNNNNDVKNH